jgi:predicted small lipoprotein YifL
MRKLLLVTLLAFLALAGCGQKGPLVPPPPAAYTN